MSPIDPAKDELIRTDESFRSLYEEHQKYKLRLEAIREKSLPSEHDEIEIKRIKLHKLSLKDRMKPWSASIREPPPTPPSDARQRDPPQRGRVRPASETASPLCTSAQHVLLPFSSPNDDLCS